MFENMSLEQFSMLDDFAPTAPVWRPFVQPAPANAPQAAHNGGEPAALG
ncbi:hypothetical protein [Burkholderia sp. 8Y]|nr:hypothetical protein [Burkholderia sp. 8Y]